MAQRKLRISLTSGYYKEIPALVDVDINLKNVEMDLEVTDKDVVKEYTFDAPAGPLLIDIVYRYNLNIEHDDSNLIINSVEIAADGENYEKIFPGPHNCNQPPDWYRNTSVRNPDFNPELPETDEITPERQPDPWTWDPGSNPGWIDTFGYFPWVIHIPGPVELRIDLP